MHVCVSQEIYIFSYLNDDDDDVGDGGSKIFFSLFLILLDEHQINQAHQYEMMMLRMKRNEKVSVTGIKADMKGKKPYYLMLG